MCFWSHSVQSSLEPSSIKTHLVSIFFNFSSPLAFIPPLCIYLGLLHPGQKKLPLDYVSSSSLPSLFPSLLHSWSLCPVSSNHFLFILWLLRIGSGQQWACKCQTHWPLSFSLYLILVTFDIVTILLFIKFPFPTPAVVFLDGALF